MIELHDKHACCGCQACMEACPSKCISMIADKEGFLYPEVNQADCISCGLCETVCPQLNKRSAGLKGNPIACYAAISKDVQARRQSSSGGVFSLLAKSILVQGGVVFGARFDDTFTVIHSYTDTETGLQPFQGSKYAQSDLHGVYSQVRQFLQERRPVLFTGTPCQIAGLQGFLHHKDDENLYLVSVVCHGAPSPRVWKDYLHDVTGEQQPTCVNMRYKENSWNRYRMLIQRNGQDLLNIQATETPYMRSFLSNLTLRPSCYSCHFRSNHGSDLTLGDYWGIENVHPEMSDDLGTSLILVYSEKGKQLLNGLELILKESQYEDALRGNPSIAYSSPEPAERALFWKAYDKRGARTLEEFTTFNLRTKIRKVWSRLVSQMREG